MTNATPWDERAPQRALLVDDDAALRGLLKVLLEQMGFQPTNARNGVEALGILRNKGAGGFDILITDIRMPEMGGIELARKARNEFPELPILFISGYAPSMKEVENELDERSDFLKKPFEFTAFADKLEKLLKRTAPARAGR